MKKELSQYRLQVNKERNTHRGWKSFFQWNQRSPSKFDRRKANTNHISHSALQKLPSLIEDQKYNVRPNELMQKTNEHYKNQYSNITSMD